MKGYTGKLKEGKEIFVPYWPVDVSLENLTKAGKYFGTENIIRISELNIPAAIVAISECKDPANGAAFIKHCICQVRIDSQKIEPDDVDTMFVGKIHEAVEMFVHVIHAQYADFFVQGLVKANSPQE